MQIIKLFLKLFLFFVAMSILPASAAQNYTCPMHPHYIVDEPGNCPICGMFLVPVKDNSSEEKVLEEESSESMQNRNMKNEHPSDKTEKKTIMIPPETIQNIGVRLEKATTARFGTGIRSYGLVTLRFCMLSDDSSSNTFSSEELSFTGTRNIPQIGQFPGSSTI
jgi:hypothetical protein